MIDTDKYEGVKGSLVHSISNEEWKKLSPAGQALVADAPLLLEEVKRLREACEAFITAVRHLDVESRNKMFNNMYADLQSIWLFRSE